MEQSICLDDDTKKKEKKKKKENKRKKEKRKKGNMQTKPITVSNSAPRFVNNWLHIDYIATGTGLSIDCFKGIVVLNLAEDSRFLASLGLFCP